MELEKIIGWGVVVLVGYYVIQAILPMFFLGLIGLVCWYCYVNFGGYK